MPDVEVAADLLIEEASGGTRQLHEDDLRVSDPAAGSGALASKQDALKARLDDIWSRLEAIRGIVQLDPATLAQLEEVNVNFTEAAESDFKRLLKFEPRAGEEIRRDETTTDDYHGAAPDGTAETTADWRIVRFYKSAGKIVRVRYRIGVRWDQRSSGW